jgi:hypothetical protein
VEAACSPNRTDKHLGKSLSCGDNYSVDINYTNPVGSIRKMDKKKNQKIRSRKYI